jgi:hypothetical protein
MGDVNLETGTDPDTRWPVVRTSSGTFRLDPGRNRYSYLHNVSPIEWREVSDADQPAIEDLFRKAYRPSGSS